MFSSSALQLTMYYFATPTNVYFVGLDQDSKETYYTKILIDKDTDLADGEHLYDYETVETPTGVFFKYSYNIPADDNSGWDMSDDMYHQLIPATDDIVEKWYSVFAERCYDLQQNVVKKKRKKN